jgi:hypothetical protein
VIVLAYKATQPETILKFVSGTRRFGALVVTPPWENGDVAREADVIVREIAERAGELVEAARDDRLAEDEVIAAIAALVPAQQLIDAGLIALVGQIELTGTPGPVLAPNEPACLGRRRAGG